MVYFFLLPFFGGGGVYLKKIESSIKVRKCFVSLFLPTVPGGGTVGLKMDFIIFSCSSFFTPTTWCEGGGVGGTVLWMVGPALSMGVFICTKKVRQGMFYSFVLRPTIYAFCNIFLCFLFLFEF